jgi:hypothetical protein
MVTAHDAGLGVFRESRCWENVLPNPLFVDSGVFFAKPKVHVNGIQPKRQVVLVLHLDLFEMQAQESNGAIREHGNAVISVPSTWPRAGFAIVHDDAVVFKTQVVDPQAQAASVKDLGHQFVFSLHLADEVAGFVFREYHWNAFAFLGTIDGDETFVEFNPENISIQEQDGAERPGFGWMWKNVFRQPGGS